MMDLDTVHKLLVICEKSLAYGPQLKALHDHALATLAAIDPNEIQIAQSEPSEDE
jgi:hypothetical protein